MKISCIQVNVIILFLEIKFKFSLHENSVHMSKYTIFRNQVQATQLNFNLMTDLVLTERCMIKRVIKEFLI